MSASDYTVTVRFLATDEKDAWYVSKRITAALEAAIPDGEKVVRSASISAPTMMMVTRYTALQPLTAGDKTEPCDCPPNQREACAATFSTCVRRGAAGDKT